MRLFSIVTSGLRGRKRDTAVLGSILFLAFLFLTLSSILLSSFSGTAKAERQQLHGAWQLMYYGVEEDTAPLLERYAPAAEMRLVGRTSDGRMIGTIDEDVLRAASLELTEGRLPQGEDEILFVRGRMSKEPEVGESLLVTYSYDYMQGNVPRRTTSREKEAVLSSYRQSATQEDEADFKAYLREHYDAEESTIGFADGRAYFYGEDPYVHKYLLPEGYDPANLTEEMEEDLRYLWAYHIYGPEKFGFDPYAVSSIVRKAGELYSYGDYSIDIDAQGFLIYYMGKGFSDDIRGSTADTAVATCETMIYRTYTVTGYVSPYADHWDVRGLTMPDAFVSPEAGGAVLEALRYGEQYYTEGSPTYTPSGILLFEESTLSTRERVEELLPLYQKTLAPGFRVEGMMDAEYGISSGFFTGLDPDTGEEKTFQLHIYRSSDSETFVNYVFEDADGRVRWISGNPTEQAHWEEFSDLLLPLQPQEPDFTELEQNNVYPLRLNNYTYPPSGSAGDSMQLLCGGVLVGVAAFSVFQVFWTQLRRRRMRLATMMSIGATDAQVLGMLLLEVLLLLGVTLMLGTAAGFGAAVLITRLSGTMFTVELPYLIGGSLCCVAAVLAGALVPMLMVLHIPLTGREQISRRTLKLRAPKRMRRMTYSRIVLRQMAVNRGRTRLQFLLAWLFAVIGLLTVFLCHDAYGEYRRSVTDTAMPDYEVVAPYGMSSRMLKNALEEAEALRQGSTVSYVTEAPNVWLHCEELLERSPILNTLKNIPEAESMFRNLEEGGTGVSVRVAGVRPDSGLLEALLEMLPADTVDLDALEKGEECILLVPRYVPEGDGVMQKTPDASALRELRADERAGAFLELHYAPRYAAVCREDNAVAAGDTIALTTYRQRIVDETLVVEATTLRPRVAAVIHVLEEGLWPYSDNKAAYVVVSGVKIIHQLYPQANTSMSAQQAAFHRVMAKIFYPDSYGLTRFTIRNLPESDAVTQDTVVADFAETYGFDFTNQRIRKEREAASAQMRRIMFLLLGIEMSLVVFTLLYSAADVAAEQDRYRIGTLQAMGVTDHQVNTGQMLQALAISVAACIAANLTMALVQVLSALAARHFRVALQENLGGYPWHIHALVCLLFILIYTLLQSLPIRRISKMDPIENIRS